MSIQSFLAQSRTVSRKETAPPAVYTAKTIKVKFDTRYKDTAVVVSYELQGQHQTYEYEERFICNKRFKRTREFYDFLDAAGFVDEDEYVGSIVELDLRWNFTNAGKRELTTESRRLIGFFDGRELIKETDDGEVDTDASI